MNSVELRTKRATLVAEARELDKKAKAEKRDLTGEESAQFDRLMDAVDGLKLKIDREERIASVESDLDAPVERVGRPLDAETRDRLSPPEAQARKMGDYRHWLRTGEVRGAFREDQARTAEYRDTIVGTDSKGGYLIAPVQVSSDIVRAVNDLVFIRSLATVTKVTEAKKLGIRKMVTRMSDADWTTEVASVTEDTAMAFDRRDLEPHLMTKLAKVSLQTLSLSSDAEREVNDELSYKFGVTEEKGFLTGNGTGKALGVFTASSSGISTGRDVVAGTTTALTADGLIDVKYSIKGGYLSDPKVSWVWHRDAIKSIRKLKDSDGQYLWQAGLQKGEPDRILDIQFRTSEFAPNTFTAGQYVGILGNFRYYRIAEINAVFLQRLVEKYADTNEVGFIGRRWVDGAPVLEEAFARVKLAAS